MKRTVQMKHGNAGGKHVTSTGCRHNPAKIRTVVRDAVTKACKGDKDHAASFLRQLPSGEAPRQWYVQCANNLLRYCKSQERVK